MVFDLILYPRYFKTLKRLDWIEIKMIPSKSLSQNSFIRVNIKWGSVVYMYKSQYENLCSTHLCILSRTMNIISKVVKMVLNDDKYMVRVKEVSRWAPYFEDEENK